jgi:hypothetical protein
MQEGTPRVCPLCVGADNNREPDSILNLQKRRESLYRSCWILSINTSGGSPLVMNPSASSSASGGSEK